MYLSFRDWLQKHFEATRNSSAMHESPSTTETQNRFTIAFDEASQTASGSHIVWVAHYFTRNRTHESDFPLFFSVHRRPRTSFPVAFVCVSGNGKGLLLVLGRVRFLVKFPIMLAVCLCDHVASSTICLVPFTGTACFSFKKESKGVLSFSFLLKL
jgi:hypothetical protein